MTTYKVGNPITVKYTNPPVPKERQYSIGQYVNIVDKGAQEKKATFIVEFTDENKIAGKIIATFGHRRRNKKQPSIVYTEEELNEMARDGLFIEDSL